jgi:hypothetical protein
MELRALPLRPCENEALLKAGEFSKTEVNAAESWVTTANIVCLALNLPASSSQAKGRMWQA